MDVGEKGTAQECQSNQNDKDAAVEDEVATSQATCTLPIDDFSGMAGRSASDTRCDKATDNMVAKWNLDASPSGTVDSEDLGSTDSWANAATATFDDHSTDRMPTRGTEIIINLPDPPSPSIRTRLRLRKPKSPTPNQIKAAAVTRISRERVKRPRIRATKQKTFKRNFRDNEEEEDDEEEDEDDERRKVEATASDCEGDASTSNEQRRKLRKRVNCVSYCEDSIVIPRQRASVGESSGGAGLGQRERVRCHECDKEFEKRYLKLHLQKHSGERPHVCDVCQKSFISKYNVKLHQQRCHSEKKTYDCDLCRRTFSSKHAATEHRRTHTGEKPYRCRICSREFSHMSAWTSHERTHNPTLLKVFLCELCDKTFKHKRSLQKHSESVHQGIRKANAYLCATCGQSYDSHSKLKVHQYRHTGERPFACAECNKSFMTKDVLRNHALIHSDIKPFQCEFCGKKFRQAITFKRHRSVHTGLKPFRCDKCNKTFIHRVYMTRHKNQNLCYKTRRGGGASRGVSKVATTVQPDLGGQVQLSTDVATN